MASKSPRGIRADESRLVEDWARLGSPDEMRRICKGILVRPPQGYPVALQAHRIIRAHVDHWLLDVPVEQDGSRKNRALLNAGPKVVRRLDRALREMIDLHRCAKDRRWYGTDVVAGAIKRRRDGSPTAPPIPWTRFSRLYQRTLKALHADPLWVTLRDTPAEMWLIPPRGNPAKRRNGALKKALRHAGLTKLQVDDVIHAIGWTLR